MVSFDIEYDDTLWLFVPELDEGDECEAWLDETSSSVTEAFGAEYHLPGGYRELIRHELGVWAELARRKADDYGNMLVYLPGPDVESTPVFVGFREPMHDWPDYLLEVAGARGLPSVQPPTVEHIVTDDLGEGIRVLRYEQDDELGLIANLCYAWRAFDTDVFVFVQTNDLPGLEAMVPDLSALTQAIHPVDGGADQSAGDAAP